MRISFIVAAALAVTAALAIEPPKDRPAAPAASGPAAPAPAPSTPAPQADAPAESPAPAAEPEVEEELPPLSPEAAEAGPPPQRFTPTEKVRADFPVSYPIDI